MDSQRPALTQLTIVSGIPGASIDFCRRLGVAVPEQGVWSTASAEL